MKGSTKSSKVNKFGLEKHEQGTPKSVICVELWRVVSDWVYPEEEMVAYRYVTSNSTSIPIQTS